KPPASDSEPISRLCPWEWKELVLPILAALVWLSLGFLFVLFLSPIYARVNSEMHQAIPWPGKVSARYLISIGCMAAAASCFGRRRAALYFRYLTLAIGILLGLFFF